MRRSRTRKVVSTHPLDADVEQVVEVRGRAGEQHPVAPQLAGHGRDPAPHGARSQDGPPRYAQPGASLGPGGQRLSTHAIAVGSKLYLRGFAKTPGNITATLLCSHLVDVVALGGRDVGVVLGRVVRHEVEDDAHDDARDAEYVKDGGPAPHRRQPSGQAHGEDVAKRLRCGDQADACGKKGRILFQLTKKSVSTTL